MNTKALVIKVDTESGIMVVFTEDRQFKQLPLPAWSLGSGTTIEIGDPSTEKWTKKFFRKKSVWVASVAAILLITSISLFYNTGVFAAATYVNLDMKSSVQLVVDKNGVVQEVLALNSEGNKLMTHKLNLKNMDVYTAVQQIVNKSMELGYLSRSEENLVMTNITTGKDLMTVVDEKQLRTVINQELSVQHYPGYVVVNQSNLRQWENAQKLGYTINQFMIFERAEEIGIQINQEDLKKENIPDFIKESHMSVPSLFPESSSKVTWEDKDINKNANQPNEMGKPSQIDQNKMYNDRELMNNGNTNSTSSKKSNWESYEGKKWLTENPTPVEPNKKLTPSTKGEEMENERQPNNWNMDKQIIIFPQSIEMYWTSHGVSELKQ